MQLVLYCMRFGQIYWKFSTAEFCASIVIAFTRYLQLMKRLTIYYIYCYLYKSNEGRRV